MTVKLDIPALVPCPWCDDVRYVRLTITRISTRVRDQHCVTCDMCLCSGPIRQTVADAATAWNTHSLTTALEIGRAMERERDGEREAREKCERALRMKDEAMGELFKRLHKADVDCSDLIP